MARLTQQNLFGDTPPQGELFAATPTPAYAPDLDKVRRRLERILAEARAAEPLCADFEEHSLYCAAFPSLLRLLPDAEAAQYRLDFEAELQRLAVAA